LTRKFTTNHKPPAAYRRAPAICDAIDEQRDRFDVVWGLWITSFQVRRDSAVVHVAELFRIAQRLDDEAQRLQANHPAWPAKVFLGQLLGRAITCARGWLSGSAATLE
jgi:hypothetical protein